MYGGSASVVGDKNTPIGLGPKKDLWIEGAKGEIIRVADSHNVDQVEPSGIVANDEAPEEPAQVFVDDVA
jgi:hypothetical protein